MSTQLAEQKEFSTDTSNLTAEGLEALRKHGMTLESQLPVSQLITELDTSSADLQSLQDQLDCTVNVVGAS